MGVDRAREHRYQHHTIVTYRGHPGDGQIRILVADDNMVADSQDHPGAGIAHRRMSEAVSVGAEVVNPQIPRHDAPIVRRSSETITCGPGSARRGRSIDPAAAEWRHQGPA